MEKGLTRAEVKKKLKGKGKRDTVSPTWHNGISVDMELVRLGRNKMRAKTKGADGSIISGVLSSKYSDMSDIE